MALPTAWAPWFSELLLLTSNQLEFYKVGGGGMTVASSGPENNPSVALFLPARWHSVDLGGEAP